jgi:hypothetical protein
MGRGAPAGALPHTSEATALDVALASLRALDLDVSGAAIIVGSHQIFVEGALALIRKVLVA